MIEVLGFSFFLLVVAYVIGRSINKLIKDKKKRNELPDEDPVQDEIVQCEYNGHPVYLSPAEQQAWCSLSRANKRAVYQNQVRMLKKGLVIKVTDSSGRTGLITKAEARQKGLIK